MNKLIKKFISIASISAVAYFTVFIFETGLAKRFGPEIYGEYQFVMSLSTVLSALICFGLPQLAVKEAKKNLINGDLTNNVLILIFFPVIILTAGVLSLLFFDFEISIISTLIALKLFFRRYFQGVGDFSIGVFLDELIYSSLLIVMFFVFPSILPTEYQIFSLLLTLLIFVLFSIYKKIGENIGIKAREISVEKINRYLIGGAFFIPFVFSQYGLRKMDSLIISPILGDSAVGIYSAAMKVSAVIIFASLIYNSVFGDKLSEYYYSGKNDLLKSLFKNSIYLSFGFGLLISVVFFISSEFIIRFFFGEEYIESVKVLNVLIFGQFINVASGPCLQLFSLTDESSFIIKLSVVMLFVSAAFFYTLTLFFGVVGSAYAFVISSFIFRFFILIKVKKVFYCG